jgi:hypothetical protein
MEDAERAREAAREALADIEPERLRAVIDGRLATASMTPGALTIVAARALDPAVDADGVGDLAAGVQLIYEGLRLTRRLAHDEPWARPTDDGLEPDTDADIDILAADVLVARGFYLLARTGAAGRAVEVVRAFGRDQTLRADADDPARLDGNLEADVLALAAVAGTTAVGSDPLPALAEYAADIARSLDHDGEFPPASSALPDAVGDRIVAIAGQDSVAGSDSGSSEEPAPATDP